MKTRLTVLALLASTLTFAVAGCEEDNSKVPLLDSGPPAAGGAGGGGAGGAGGAAGAGGAGGASDAGARDGASGGAGGTSGSRDAARG